MSAKAARPTLLDQAIARVGILKAGKVLGYLVLWAWAAEDFGPDMSATQFGQKWELSPATAYRYQADIRHAFGDLDLPELLRHVQAQTKDRPHTKLSATLSAGLISSLGV